MCGIAGYCGLDLPLPERRAVLERMSAALTHRGPDEHGERHWDQAGLAVRRLSIVDLAHGSQPLVDEPSATCIAYNGEVYNHAELRCSMEANGQSFATHSDTEVVLRAYLDAGPGALQGFNGMFAFAVWDEPRGQLFLARDRMGVKPLYYFWDGQALLFASEIKALLASGLVRRQLNEQALWDYLTFRYVPGPQTIWRNVFKLPPAHTLTFLPGVGVAEPSLTRYWELKFSVPDEAPSFADSCDEFRSLFEDAVRIRLLADVPVGILLSGGLDSSAVAATASRQSADCPTAFTVGFADAPETDERAFARQVAEHYGLPHEEVLLGTSDFAAALTRLVHDTDEPLADLAAIPLLLVCQLAQRSVKVVLSGEGSDEVLAGYNFDVIARNVARMERYQQVLPSPIRSMATRLSRGPLAARLRRANTPLNKLYVDHPLAMTNYWTESEKRRLWSTADVRFRPSLEPLRNAVCRSATAEPLNQALFAYSQDWLVEDLLMKADKMSMATSLELREPFLDYRLVEWAARAPLSVKVGPDGTGRYTTKRVLREVAREWLPSAILDRPKRGFPVPALQWMDGPLKPFLTELLNGDLALHRWLDPLALRDQISHDFAATDPIHRHRVWNLAIMELWLREWRPE